MGYTHYWEAKGGFNAEQYAKAIEEIRVVVEKCSNILANGHGDFGTQPEFSTDICFNGIDYTTQNATDHSHETFFLSASGIGEFNCCKTNQKPYDAVVVACLAVLAEVEGVQVASDGDRSDWEEGVKLASAALGRPVQIPSTIDE